MNPSATAKSLSFPQKRALRNVADGYHVACHCKTQADYGGLESTIRSLVRRGLMDDKHDLTEKGKRVAALLQKGGERWLKRASR